MPPARTAFGFRSRRCGRVCKSFPLSESLCLSVGRRPELQAREELPAEGVVAWVEGASGAPESSAETGDPCHHIGHSMSFLCCFSIHGCVLERAGGGLERIFFVADVQEPRPHHVLEPPSQNAPRVCEPFPKTCASVTATLPQAECVDCMSPRGRSGEAQERPQGLLGCGSGAGQGGEGGFS